MPDDNFVNDVEFADLFAEDDQQVSQTGELLYIESQLMPRTSQAAGRELSAPPRGAESVADLQNLFTRISVRDAVGQLKELLSRPPAAGSVERELPVAGSAIFRGQPTSLVGFDGEGRGAVIGSPRPEQHELSTVIPVAAVAENTTVTSSGDVYRRMRPGGAELWINELSSGKPMVCRAETQADGSLVLRQTNLKLVPAGSTELSVTLSEVPKAAPPDRPVESADFDKDATFDRPADGADLFLENEFDHPSARALGQSNDYAAAGKLAAPLADGFRTAGRYRLFDSQGAFEATDRAAILVDRHSDKALVQLLAELRKHDEELKARGASEQERAESLAARVHAIMHPAGVSDEQLDQQYRAFMKENAGKTIRLGDLIGSGSCNPSSLILKLAADEAGLKCTLQRGNNGTHVWTTFSFANEAEPRIFDVKAEVYGVEESKSQFHQPDCATVPACRYAPGQAVSFKGEEWKVAGTDAGTGEVELERVVERLVATEDVIRLNAGKQLRPGDVFVLPVSAASDATESGASQRWVLQGINQDGRLIFIRTESTRLSSAQAAKESALDAAREVDSPLELAGNPDLQYLKDNWSTLLETEMLSAKQKAALEAALKNLATAPADKAKDFRKLICEIAKVASTSPLPDKAQQRVEALAKIAEVAGKFPDRIHLPVDNIVNATDADVLKQVSETIAQSAPHLEKPAKAGTVDPSLRDADSLQRGAELDGKGYEYQMSQAMQKALQNKALINRLMTEGKFPKGNWMYVPSAPGSPLDHMNCDGMLVDLDTGKALFFDFAMPSKGTGGLDHGAFRLKLGTVDKRGRPKAAEPWAFSVGKEAVGYDAKANAYTGPIDAAALLGHVAEYAKGTLPDKLLGEGSGVTQPKPDPINIKTLKNKLGEFPSARPVNSELEAAALSREEGKRVRSTKTELTDIENSLRGASSTSEKTMFNGVKAASSHAHEVDVLGGVFGEGLRAAVEAEKYGISSRSYGGKDFPAPTIRLSGPDVSAKCPSPYRGVPFIELQAGNMKLTPASLSSSQIRLYPNGEIVLVPQWSSDVYIPLGKIQDLGDRVMKALVEAGHDPADFKDIASKFKKIDFEKLKKAIADMNGKEAAFWEAHPELKLLADAVHHGADHALHAKDYRPVYEARNEIDNHGDLSTNLSEQEKKDLAEKAAKLRKGKQGLSIEDVKAVLDIEKAAGLSEADALKVRQFQKQVDPAELWTPAEAATKFQDAAKASKDYSGRSVVEVYHIEELRTRLGVDAATANTCYELRKTLGPSAADADLKNAADLFNRMQKKYKGKGCDVPTHETVADLYAKHKAITDAEIAAMAKIARKHPAHSLAEIATIAKRNLEMERIRPLIERTEKLWRDMEMGALPKSLNKDFAYLMGEALKELKAEGLDPAVQSHYEDVVRRYNDESKAATPTDALPKDIHDFFESPRKTGATGDRVWQVPSNLSQSEQDLFARRLARYGQNQLGLKAEYSKFAQLIDAQTARWSEDLQPLARRASDLNGKLQEAHRAAQEQALKEAGTPEKAAKLLQSGEGSDALKKLRGDWKDLVDQHAKCTEELMRECKTRAEALQKTVNEFTRAHKLPPVQIRVLEHINGAGGHYVRGNGDFRVTVADLLNPAAGAELAGTLYHEVVHLQQDTLVLRKIMDDLKISQLSADPTTRAEQLNRIRERYNTDTGAQLPEAGKEKSRWESFMEDVATIRDGKALSDLERTKADMLAKSFKDGSALGLKFQQTADAVRVLENELNRLKDRSGNRVAEDLVARLAAEGREGDVLRSQFFGEKPSGALYDLVEQYRKAAKDSSGRAKTWNEVAARKTIADHIDGPGGKGGRIDTLNAERQKMYRDYIRPMYEQEATLYGNRVHAMETRQVLRASFEGTNGATGDAKPPESKPPEVKPTEVNPPVDPNKPRPDELLDEIPVEERDRRANDPKAGRDKPLDVKILEGPNGLKLLADRLAEPKLMEKLKEYNTDAKFREAFEKKIKEAKNKEDKEKLEQEYERYKKLAPGEQELVRRHVIAEAVEAHLAKQAGREWMRTGEKALGAAGTFIAVFMLAELILGECKTGTSGTTKPVNPTPKK